MLIVIIIKIKVIKYTFIVHTVSEMCKPKCHGGSNNTTHPISVILHQEVYRLPIKTRQDTTQLNTSTVLATSLPWYNLHVGIVGLPFAGDQAVHHGEVAISGCL